MDKYRNRSIVMIDWVKTREKHGYGCSVVKEKCRFSVIVRCDECNSEFNKIFRNKKQINDYDNCDLCMKCRYNSDEMKNKFAESSKETWKKHGHKIIATKQTKEYKDKISKSIKEKWKDENFRERVINNGKITRNTKQSRMRNSNNIKKKWKDEEYRSKIVGTWTEEKKKEMANKKSEYFANKRKEFQLEFIKKSSEIHNNKYDYSKVKYINSRSNVVIICPDHGEFKQSPTSHLNGNGCSKCGREKSTESHMLSTEEFIDKASIVHNNKYDYSKVDYVDTRTPIIIICPKHGEFKQIPNNHMSGDGCRRCADDITRLTTDEFVYRAKEVHGNRYNYSKVDYVNHQTKVTIVCNKHGEFRQTPNNHLRGHGCHKCAGTNSQNELYEFVRHVCPDAEYNDRSAIAPFELDVFVPSKMVAIEFNGVYWHSYNYVETPEEKKRHLKKLELCMDKEIRLIQIQGNEWRDNKEIVKSIIRSKLGNTNRIHARKCELKEISSHEHMEFMNNNHIQGGKGCNVAYGLYFQNELVSVMSFNKHHKYGWEITRFANKLDTTVVGGASKLFKKFVVDVNPEQILTYADRRYSDGNLYRKLGFEFDGYTNPNYCYVDSRKQVHSRQQFQKHKLKNKLENFDPNLSEAENMFNHGYRRLWDAGNHRFLWRK